MMRWGFGIAFISLFLAIIFAITSIIYASMARRLNMVFSDANILIHWEYSQEEWLRYSKEEFKKQKLEKRNIFITITAITIVVGGIFTLIHRDAWKVLSIVFAGLLLLLALIAFIIPKIISRVTPARQGIPYCLSRASFNISFNVTCAIFLS